MPSTVSFVVTSWAPDEPPTRALVESLCMQGVDPRRIHISDERVSRPMVLNRAIAACDSDYIGFCESDVYPSPNAVATLTRLLDRNPKIGLAAAKVEATSEQPTAAPVPLNDPGDPDETSLEDISGQMWTLNFVLYRKSTQVLFEEAYFGNQVFDWDFGLDLQERGYSSMVDRRCAVAHRHTDFFAKSLSYHACVARNRHIFRQKWHCRADWQGLAAFDRANRGVIPTIEELTHATEEWQFKYIAEFDQHSFQEFYFKTRFGDAASIDAFLQSARPFLRPHVWAPPVVSDLAGGPRQDLERCLATIE